MLRAFEGLAFEIFSGWLGSVFIACGWGKSISIGPGSLFVLHRYLHTSSYKILSEVSSKLDTLTHKKGRYLLGFDISLLPE